MKQRILLRGLHSVIHGKAAMRPHPDKMPSRVGPILEKQHSVPSAKKTNFSGKIVSATSTAVIPYMKPLIPTPALSA